MSFEKDVVETNMKVLKLFCNCINRKVTIQATMQSTVDEDTVMRK